MSDGEERARELAARTLARRDLSRAALARRLAVRGVAVEEAGEAADALARAGYLDDARLAVSRAERLAERGLGDAAIDARLEAEGLQAEQRLAALAGLVAERDRALEIARRERARGLRQVGALLQRRGFGEDAVEAALGTLVGLGSQACDD